MDDATKANDQAEQEHAHESLQQLVAYRLSRVQAKMNAQATRILRQNGGLTLVQWRVMLMLDIYGKITVGQIARITQFDKALISRTARSLVDLGYATMHTDEKDQRRHFLSKTQKGARVFNKAEPAMAARQDALMSALSEQQKQVLFAAFDNLEDVADRAMPA